MTRIQASTARTQERHPSRIVKFVQQANFLGPDTAPALTGEIIVPMHSQRTLIATVWHHSPTGRYLEDDATNADDHAYLDACDLCDTNTFGPKEGADEITDCKTCAGAPT